MLRVTDAEGYLHFIYKHDTEAKNGDAISCGEPVVFLLLSVATLWRRQFRIITPAVEAPSRCLSYTSVVKGVWYGLSLAT